MHSQVCVVPDPLVTLRQVQAMHRGLNLRMLASKLIFWGRLLVVGRTAVGFGPGSSAVWLLLMKASQTAAGGTKTEQAYARE